MKGERPMCLPDAEAFAVVPVFDRYTLEPGFSATGPAIIEEVEATTVVMPAFDVTVDAALNLVLTRRPS